MSDLREDKLDFWIQKNYNVLFVGKHGVGKTALITNAFNRAGLKWKYFSASTMDPWVDFVGLPKERLDEKGISYIDLIRPKEFAYDEVEALFFDEYSRSHKKIRNAVMELIQFKSINGKKFNNLKLVWAAINPSDDDDSYDVEKLDPAQLDRFHVQVEVPYKPIASYFSQKYGADLAQSGIAWWNELPNDIKKEVSPRRLDYALDMYQNQGDLRDVLPAKANITKLQLTLRSGPIKKILGKFVDQNDTAGAAAFITQENNYAASVNYLMKKKKFTDFFLPLLAPEKIASLLVEHKNIKKTVIDGMQANPKYNKIIQDILSANQNKNLVRDIRNALPVEVKQKQTAASWDTKLDQILIKMRNYYNTQQRYAAYKELTWGFPTQAENLSLLSAIKAAEILNQIVARTQPYTLTLPRRYQLLNEHLSAAFSRIAADTNEKTVQDICRVRNWADLNEKVSKRITIHPIAALNAVPQVLPQVVKV